MGSQVGGFLLARRTAPNGDPLDSSLFWWASLVLPLVGFTAALYRPWGKRPLVWAAALVAPHYIGVALLGALPDPDRGASFWVVGEIFIAAVGVLILSACFLGQAARHQSIS